MSISTEKGPTGRIRGLRQLLAGVTKADVLNAIEQFSIEKAERYGFAESMDFDLVYEGRCLPPKAILGLAAAREIGRPLEPAEFSGGEASACFAILRSLGFSIERKKVMEASESKALGLTRFTRYDREEISQIFEPGVKFTRGAGRWGLQGIIESPAGSANFVFMVTLGEPDESNPYQDALTADGKLIWESQTQHDFNSSVIKKLLSHNDEDSNIHLFLRAHKKEKYIYLGLLSYYSHDPHKQNPVHFIWALKHWDLELKQLKELGIPLHDPIDPTFSIPSQPSVQPQLSKTAPPTAKRQPSKNHQVREAVKEWTVDWAARDQRNRQLGLLGEELVLTYEIQSLRNAGRSDLADEVRHVALTDSTAGYDIASFHLNGQLKRIEVKTTQGPASTPFYISINEVLASRDTSSSYSIYRVFGLRSDSTSVSFFELEGDVEEICKLEPISFRAFPGSK